MSKDIEDCLGCGDGDKCKGQQVTEEEKKKKDKDEKRTKGRPPIVPCYYPFTRTLEPGKTYRWCACGRSKTQPW